MSLFVPLLDKTRLHYGIPNYTSPFPYDMTKKEGQERFANKVAQDFMQKMKSNPNTNRDAFVRARLGEIPGGFLLKEPELLNIGKLCQKEIDYRVQEFEEKLITSEVKNITTQFLTNLKKFEENLRKTNEKNNSNFTVTEREALPPLSAHYYSNGTISRLDCKKNIESIVKDQKTPKEIDDYINSQQRMFEKFAKNKDLSMKTSIRKVTKLYYPNNSRLENYIVPEIQKRAADFINNFFRGYVEPNDQSRGS